MSSENFISTITFSGTELARQMARSLHAEGMPPIMAVERALERQLFEAFRDGFGNRLVKPPTVRFHSMYFKERYSSLAALALTGYETWYTEIDFSTRLGDQVNDLQIVSDGINMLPIDYGYGVRRKSQIKARLFKRQINHNFRINHLQVSGQIFQEVKNQLTIESQLKQPLIANLSPGPDISGYRMVSFDHILTGARLFCRCAKSFHTSIINTATKLVLEYALGSWPQSILELLKVNRGEINLREK